MDYLVKWKEAVYKNRLLFFVDLVLKGYGQVIVCLNPFTGFLLCLAIFFLSGIIGLLTLLAVIASTSCAFIIGARPLHIHSGIYGFNGVVLGVAWLWFIKINIISIILLVIFACLSTILMKILIDLSSRTKTNLPIFSVPALTLIWLLFISLRCLDQSGVLAGPDARMLLFWQGHQNNFVWLLNHFNLPLFLKTFYKYIIAMLIIYAGIRLHSRITARFCLAAFCLSLLTLYLLGGRKEFINLEFYLYNAVPCAASLGGTFLVANRRAWALTVLAAILTTAATFIGFHYWRFPIFVAPFNFITIFCIWLVKADILKRKQGFIAVPMELISTAEFGLEWYKGELFADNYWRQIQNSA